MPHPLVTPLPKQNKTALHKNAKIQIPLICVSRLPKHTRLATFLWETRAKSGFDVPRKLCVREVKSWAKLCHSFQFLLFLLSHIKKWHRKWKNNGKEVTEKLSVLHSLRTSKKGRAFSSFSRFTFHFSLSIHISIHFIHSLLFHPFPPAFQFPCTLRPMSIYPSLLSHMFIFVRIPQVDFFPIWYVRRIALRASVFPEAGRAERQRRKSDSREVFSDWIRRVFILCYDDDDTLKMRSSQTFGQNQWDTQPFARALFLKFNRGDEMGGEKENRLFGKLNIFQFSVSSRNFRGKPCKSEILIFSWLFSFPSFYPKFSSSKDLPKCPLRKNINDLVSCVRAFQNNTYNLTLTISRFAFTFPRLYSPKKTSLRKIERSRAWRPILWLTPSLFRREVGISSISFFSGSNGGGGGVCFFCNTHKHFRNPTDLCPASESPWAPAPGNHAMLSFNFQFQSHSLLCCICFCFRFHLLFCETWMKTKISYSLASSV